jgi:DNA modification methylase
LSSDLSNIISNLIRTDWSFSSEPGEGGLYALHPYPAKFIPQIPYSLIKNIGVANGGVVFDPFCGSGTTLLVSQSLGYSSIGIDLNPIACLISKVATSRQPQGLKESANRCVQSARTIENSKIPDIPNLNHWFKKPVQKSIKAILDAIQNETSEQIRDILNLALSSTIVRVSNQDGDTRYAAVEKNVSGSDVISLFSKACSRYANFLQPTDSNLSECNVQCGNILDKNKDEINRPIGLVICSPPYPNAYEYWLYHKYRMWWLGHDPLYVKKHEIGARPHYFKKNSQTPDDFRNQMSNVFSLLKEICIDNSYACFVIGDSKIHGEIIDNTELLREAAAENNFETIAVINRNIAQSRKSFNLTNSRLKNEDLVVFRKLRKFSSNQSSLSVILYSHSYNYLPYEKKLALREVAAIPQIRYVSLKPNEISITLPKKYKSKLKDLVYFYSFQVGNGNIEKTLQAKLENGTTSEIRAKKKQATRYGVHGLHDYKGKFNPQIVRGILNTYGIDSSSRVLDPFCGSGTTLIESTIAGSQSIGWDLNPFAIYLSNAKISILHSHPDKLSILSKNILSRYHGHDYDFPSRNKDSEDYLKKWFPEENYIIFEKYRSVILNEAGDLASFFLLILSNLLRNYSLQEPKDLRIRRRYSPWPTVLLQDIIHQEFSKQIKLLETSFIAHGPLKKSAKAVVADGRNWKSVESAGIKKSSCDFALTSPPYSTALPYIDTQRLSLIWLDLLTPSNLRHSEETLIGSREAKKSELDSLFLEMNSNSTSLPNEHIEYCKNLANQVSKDDGFRRKAVPNLLYRYFSDMFMTFDTVSNVIKSDGFYALIVGTNRTTLGGKTFIIDTPGLLRSLAENMGWKVQEMLPLETYKRYGLHSNNAIQQETLLVLKNE